MAEGIVGLAFGVSGVFTLVDQCLTLYQHIDEARTFGENVWQQYVLFQHECARFTSWQKEMRDFHVVSRPSLPSSSLSTGLETPNADDLMHNTLAQIVSILEAVQTLCKEYRVNELDRSGRAKLKKADVADLSTGLATTVIGSAIASDGKLALSAQTKRQNESSLKKNTSLFKRIRYGTKLWKESDKESLQQLVTQFAHWNDCLQRFLPTTRRMLLDLVSSSTILEGEVELSDLDCIRVAASTGLYESLARRVALKQANLESSSGPSLKKGLECLGDIDIRSIMSLPRAVIAVFGLGKGPEPVKCLVEWKSYASYTDYDSIVEAEQQVEELVKLLNFSKKPRSMNVLDCFGYFQYEDPDHRFFGFLHAFPPNSDTNNSPVSLNELLLDMIRPKRSHILPSLPQRVRIAQSLAITLLELHNAEWLHKDLNSQNIVFFYTSGKALDFNKPFVSGFEYARPDKTSAASFEVRGSPMDIYRHPSLLGPFPPGQERPRFEMKHDIYSLGLILLEIGLWQQLGVFRKAGTKPADFFKLVKQLAIQELPHRVGDVYRDVVLRCIEGEGLYTKKDEAQQEGPSPSRKSFDEQGGRDASLVNFYWVVVRELERCHCK